MDIRFRIFVEKSNALKDAKLSKAMKIANDWYIDGIKLSEWTEDANFVMDHCFGDAVGNDISDLIHCHDVTDDEYTEIVDSFVMDVRKDIASMEQIVKSNFEAFA